MRDAALLFSTALILTLGYFFVKKLDSFLENNHYMASDSRKDSVLRIAFENSMMTESIADLLEAFSKKKPKCEIQLFSGSSQKITDMLMNNELDFGCIAENSYLSNSMYCVCSVSFKLKGVRSDSTGLRISPLNEEKCKLNIIWLKNNLNKNVNIFCEELTKYCPK